MGELAPAFLCYPLDAQCTWLSNSLNPGFKFLPGIALSNLSLLPAELRELEVGLPVLLFSTNPSKLVSL